MQREEGRQEVTEEENPQLGLSGFSPEFEMLKDLPADKRRALVEELALMGQESPEVAHAARLLMEALEPEEGGEESK